MIAVAMQVTGLISSLLHVVYNYRNAFDLTLEKWLSIHVLEFYKKNNKVKKINK